MLNRIKGGIFGLATGDALGSTLEFLNEAQIKHMHNVFGVHKDFKGGGPFHWEIGEVTDDTDMTLCVARGIIENPQHPIDHIGDEFLFWLNSHPKDVGMTVRQSLVNYQLLQNWELASLETHRSLNGKSGGNGSLMRCLPIGLAYPDNRSINLLSSKQSKMTHYDSKAENCCILYNQIVKQLLNEKELKEALELCLADSSFFYSLESKPTNKPDAYVGHTFEWLCYVLYNTYSFEEAVIEAVNLGYDSDTLGATVGGLAGVYYGFENIPNRFSSQLLLKDELDKISNSLYDIRISHGEPI